MRLKILDPLLLTLLLLSGQPLSLAAADALQGQVRLLAGRGEPAWVGQEVELHLELWSDGFSFGDQLFVLPEVKGGFLLQGDSSTVKLSEMRGGVSWQGLRYTLLLYPQLGGLLEIPSFEVSFSSRAGFGSEPSTFRYRTEPLAVEARLPPGVDPGDLLVTTGAFEFEARWDRDLPGEGALRLQTGDALTLEVRRRAADVPGMVFSPLQVPEIEGLGVYPASPVVQDKVNRGELTGLRIDTLTFVCESDGRFEIPEFRFQWWNPDAQILSERVIPAVPLEVEVNPAFGTGPAVMEPVSRERVAGLLALLLGGSVVGLLAWRRLRGSRWLANLHVRQPGRSRVTAERTGRLLPLNPRREL